MVLHSAGGTGEPLLIAHATGFCGRAYDPFAALLAAHFQVFAVDLRGHGDATAPADGDFSWGGMADDVLAALAAIDTLVTGPVHSFGHSMGGAALLEAEMRHPGSLRSAYLFEPIVLPPGVIESGPNNPLAGPARRRREVFASRAEAFHRYGGRPPLNTLRADALYAYVEHGFRDEPDGTVRLKCAAENEARTFESAAKVLTTDIGGIAIPVCVATGSDREPMGPARFAPEIVAALPHADYLVDPLLGHFGPLESPAKVAAEVIAWIAATGAAT